MFGAKNQNIHIITVDSNGFVETRYGEPDSKLESAIKTLAGATMIASRILGENPHFFKVSVNIGGWSLLISGKSSGGFAAIAWREDANNIHNKALKNIQEENLIEKLSALPDPFFGEGIV